MNDVLQLTVETNILESPQKRIVKKSKLKLNASKIGKKHGKTFHVSKKLKSIIKVPSVRSNIAETEKTVTRHNFVSEISVTIENISNINNRFENFVCDIIDEAFEKSKRENIKPENTKIVRFNFENLVCNGIDSGFEKSAWETIEPSNARIIQLNNKYVPKGVHFAIAVDKTKFLSKNSLKKITRNLTKMM